MTRMIFQDDSYCFEFEAVVTEIIKRKNDFGVILDTTAFYPEAGGQLPDRGSIDGFEVTDVQKSPEENVIHYVKEWKAEIGTSVKGIIDADWRLDNMRKHTGQHILSGVFQSLAGAATVSSHLGEIESTLEIDREDLRDEIVLNVEIEANRIIMANDPVDTFRLDREEMKGRNIRRIPDREGPFRIVRIGEVDQTACGGTHLKRTGEVGIVKIISVEKIRGHQRFTFLTGEKALRDYHAKNKVTGELSTMLTCHYGDLPESVGRLLEQNSTLRREIGRLSRELRPYEAEKIRKKAEFIGEIRLVSEIRTEDDPDELKNLGQYLAESDKSINLLATGERLLITISEGIPLKAGNLARMFCEKFEGKGGGNPVFAQIGRIPSEKMEEYLGKFKEMIRNELGRD